jgi:Flp pilus assembly protein CpaB
VAVLRSQSSRAAPRRGGTQPTDPNDADVRSPRAVARRAGPVHQVRLFVARRPLLHWLLIGLAAALTGAFVYSRAAAADAARGQWGSARTVVVATRDLPAGHRVAPGDLRRQRWPVALVPPDARASLDEGVVIATPVAAGQPVLGRDLGRGDAGPVAATLAPGRRAVTIPVGDLSPPVVIGDRVDLVAAGAGPGAAVVARGATVVEVRERAVVVAVTADELADVAGGIVGGTVVVAVSGDPPLSP